MLKTHFHPLKVFAAGIFYLFSTGVILAQSANSQAGAMPLTDLSAFKNPGKTWQLASNVYCRS